MTQTALRRGSQEEGNTDYFTGCPIGGGFMWYGLPSKIPSNCRVCDNTTLAIASYTKLHENLGGAWGTSGGNLNIPDLRGKFPRGVDGGAANDPDRASRAANATGGNTGDAVGSIQGNDNKAHFHHMFNNEAGATVPTANLTSSNYVDADPNGNVNYMSYAMTSTTTALPTLGKTSDQGAGDTRPINANVYFVIRVS